MEVTFYDYLATKVPNDCYAILCMDGKDVPRPQNAKQLASMLKQYIRLYGKEGLDKLAQVHPDRELIMGADRPVKDSDFGLNNLTAPVSVEKDESNFSNFCAGCSLAFDGKPSRERKRDCSCGCGGNCGGNKNESFSNATGDTPQYSTAHQIFLASGILILAAAFIYAVKK